MKFINIKHYGLLNLDNIKLIRKVNCSSKGIFNIEFDDGDLPSVEYVLEKDRDAMFEILKKLTKVIDHEPKNDI